MTCGPRSLAPNPQVKVGYLGTPSRVGGHLTTPAASRPLPPSIAPAPRDSATRNFGRPAAIGPASATLRKRRSQCRPLDQLPDLANRRIGPQNNLHMADDYIKHLDQTATMTQPAALRQSGTHADKASSRPAKIDDVLIVGAGISGMYNLYKLRELGLSVRIIERASGVGGTWFWNRYPGARCDAPSIFYSLSHLPELDQDWNWSERFAAQPEILNYLNEVAARSNVLEHITFNASLTDAHWDDATAAWISRTDTGEVIRSKYLIMATGPLSEPRVPDIPGLGSFQGRWFHTGRWPHEPISFAGRRVAVIGTGSTGVQVIQTIANEAEQVLVLQRTPKFVLPAANGPMTTEELAAVKEAYPTLRAQSRLCDFGTPIPPPEYDLRTMGATERDELLESLYPFGLVGLFISSYHDHLGLKNREVNDIVADFVRKKIRETVKDPVTAELLTPRGYPIGINRIILGIDYYESYNRDNVVLHSVLEDPIVELTQSGVRTRTGEFDVDDVIFATGYDAITGSFTAVDIQGTDGKTLREHWSDGPTAYLGMQLAGMPNLFLINGPGSPSVLGNVITTIEQSSDFILQLVKHAEENDFWVIEPDADAQSAWMDHVAEVAAGTLFREAHKANSWYSGSNVPGKKVVFMPYAGGVGKFQTVLDDVAREGFRGFTFSHAEKPMLTSSG